jgi:hypothetical protein
MSAYSDSIFEPVFFESAPVFAKKNIEMRVEIGFFRPFPSLVRALGMDLTLLYLSEKKKAFAFQNGSETFGPNYHFSPNELCFLVP